MGQSQPARSECQIYSLLKERLLPLRLLAKTAEFNSYTGVSQLCALFLYMTETLRTKLQSPGWN